jgi:hypothetical protein
VTTDLVDAGVLEAGPVRLEPLKMHHVDDLWKAAATWPLSA